MKIDEEDSRQSEKKAKVDEKDEKKKEPELPPVSFFALFKQVSSA
jgi:hypothetical protein